MKLSEERLAEMIAGMRPFADMPWGLKFNEFSSKDLYAAMMELQELRAAQQWVPVTEGLPEVDRQVDLYNINGAGRITDLTVYQGADLYFDDETNSPIELSEITHWRYSEDDRPPLPVTEGE